MHSIHGNESKNKIKKIKKQENFICGMPSLKTVLQRFVFPRVDGTILLRLTVITWCDSMTKKKVTEIFDGANFIVGDHGLCILVWEQKKGP